MIIGLSGRKQSGKSTAGNLIYSLYMAQTNIAEKVLLSSDGEIIVSDLLGNESYAGKFLPYRYAHESEDVVINEVFNTLDPLIQIYNFADILKGLCMDIFDFSYNQCYGTDENKNELVEGCFWPSTTPSHEVGLDKQMTAREVMQYVGTDIFRNIKKDVWVKSTINKIKKQNAKLSIITDCRFPNEVDIIKQNGGAVIRLTRSPFDSEHLSETVLDKENYDWDNFDYIIDNKNTDLYAQCDQIKKITLEILKL